MKNKFVLFLLSLLVFVVLFEYSLRQFLGFCDTVLLREDPDYEYIAKPNQKRYRFRQNVEYNSLSMRSDEVDSNAIVILGFGDSVINGGVQTDQDSLATSILTNELTNYLNEKVQFLNVSAGSWGPDNCYQYLKKNQNLNPKAIFLFVSSHDAYDNMSFEPIVGINKSFPKEQYDVAIFELFDRYLIPRLKKFFNIKVDKDNELGINKRSVESVFNEGFSGFEEYTRVNNIPFVIYLHADKSEYKFGKYNNQGLEIINFAKDNNVGLIKDLDADLDKSEFRDLIHINDKGQRLLAKRVFKYIQQNKDKHFILQD